MPHRNNLPAGSAIAVKLGARARTQIERGGLKPADITCVPAAAGGPKGLALIPFDQWLFGEWFRSGTHDAAHNPAHNNAHGPVHHAAHNAAHEPTLIGASIGAWRMAAAAQQNPVAALAELSRTYIEDQVYTTHPPPAEVSALIRLLAQSTFRLDGWQPRATVPLRVLTARAAGALHGDASRTAFARAALDNAAGRARLARHLRRVVFSAGAGSQIDAMLQGTGSGFDAFGAERAVLTAHNAEQALLASGSIPLLCEPVKQMAGLSAAGNGGAAAAAPAPAAGAATDVRAHASDPHDAWYWDGGLIDYHLFFPYSQLDGLVLYPHFVDHIVPGWLDKFLPWRKEGRGSARSNDWLSNVILISPSTTFLRTLPNGKLPDRNDFHRYGLDHARRIKDWKRALAECQRFAEQAAAWLQAPDLSIARAL